MYLNYNYFNNGRESRFRLDIVHSNSTLSNTMEEPKCSLLTIYFIQMYTNSTLHDYRSCDLLAREVVEQEAGNSRRIKSGTIGHGENT